jgi:hypothetical protein
MAALNNVDNVLHRVKVKLYPNTLGVGGAYYARTDNEAVLTIDQVCAALVTRGGFTGNYGDLLENIKQFFDEAAYQLVDGYAVNMRYFSVYPNIGGTFSSTTEAHNHKKNPVDFRFRINSALKKLVKHITIEIEGLADCSGWIEGFFDPDEVSDTTYSPGDQFILTGSKIKVVGDDPSCGVYFVPEDDPSQAVKVTRIAENTPSKIIGIAPKTNHQHNKVEIRSQFTGSVNRFLKTVNVIKSEFVIEES